MSVTSLDLTRVDAADVDNRVGATVLSALLSLVLMDPVLTAGAATTASTHVATTTHAPMLSQGSHDALVVTPQRRLDELGY